ncbi:hypothetical protein [Rhodoblastus sp.]|uniref:hypothetical protein n=1 Tax=Rhodoblastus sp. TaxID=1962975 RepID=UPI003F9C91F6
MDQAPHGENRRGVFRFPNRKNKSGFHVAFMSRGVAAPLWKSLEIKGSRRNTMQHEKAAYWRLFRGLSY